MNPRTQAVRNLPEYFSGRTGQRRTTDFSCGQNHPSHTYDAGSRLTTEVTNGTTKTFTYDNTDQLTADSTNTFTYDATGNRNNGSYATGSGNRLTNDGLWTYTYDHEGSMTKKSKGASQETWTYGYDQKNQLLWVEKRATDGGTLQQKVEFKYDAWGDRIEKKIDADGNGSWDTTQRYAYDGWNPAKGRAIGLEEKKGTFMFSIDAASRK